MNFLAPGLRELARLSDRSIRRLRLVAQRRKLAQLESNLGLLGWQQAEYGADAQHHVNRLNDVERVQGQLTNQSAELGVAIGKLDEQRTAERETYEQNRTAREAARAPLVGPVQEAERAWNDRERERKELRDRIATLTREIGSNEEKYRTLLTKGDHTAKEAEEVARLQKRVIAIPHEQREWQHKLASVEAEMPALETELHQRRALLATETEALSKLEKDFKKSDDARVEEIAARKREKQKIEKEIEALEKTKTRPYREIGKVLADHGIEPLNQPEALTAVLKQREEIAAQEAQVTESLSQSAGEKREDVWMAWVLLACAALLVWFALWFVFRAR